MSNQDVAMLELWAEATGKVLEWTTDEGRTFQICGIKGVVGRYERFFHKGSHPTRQPVSTDEIANQLQKAASQFELYRGQKGSGDFYADFPAALGGAQSFFSCAAA